MKDYLKRHGVSFAQTFIATFLSILAVSITQVGPENWTAALVGSILVAALRSAVKMSIEKFLPTVASAGIK